MQRLLIILITIVLLGCGNEDVTKGDRLFERGKFEEAIKAYDEYLKLQPTHVKSIYNRGRSYEELGHYQRALQDFEQVLEIDAKNANAFLSIGNFHYRENRFDLAAYNFSKGVEHNDNDPEGHYMLGRALHQMGKFDQSLLEFNLALNLDRQFGDVYLHRGILNISMNNRRKGCEDFRAAQALEVAGADDMLSKYCR